MIKRCYICQGIIWPWSRAGYYISHRRTIYWHARHAR